MKISTKTQLTLIFLAIACLIGVVTSLIVNSLITDQIIFEAQERVKEDLNTARWVYNSKLRDIEADNSLALNKIYTEKCIKK